MKLELYDARLIEEEKRRFRCVIEIEGKRESCYVPCSSKLSKYMPIEEKRVLVKKNLKNNLMEYRLIAVKNENEWVVVDFILLNSLLKEYYENLGYKVKREQVITSEYKADLLIEQNKNTVIEIKGILSLEEIALEPLNNSERTMRQLREISKVLNKENCNVHYVYVLLNTNIKAIHVNKEEYSQIMTECLKKGMEIDYFRIRYYKNCICVCPARDIKFIL